MNIHLALPNGREVKLVPRHPVTTGGKQHIPVAGECGIATTVPQNNRVFSGNFRHRTPKTRKVGMKDAEKIAFRGPHWASFVCIVSCR